MFRIRRLRTLSNAVELFHSTIKHTTEHRREHISFNKMLRLSIVNGQRLPPLITLVMTPQNAHLFRTSPPESCTELCIRFSPFSARNRPDQLLR